MCPDSIKSIKQGETLTITGQVFNGENTVIDWAGYNIEFLIFSQSKALFFSSESANEDSYPVTLLDGGIILFRISGDVTRMMLGNYYIEGKITKDADVAISDKIVAFQVIESQMGIMDKI